MAATILKVIDLVIGTFFNDKITIIIAGINKKHLYENYQIKLKIKNYQQKLKDFLKKKINKIVCL